MKKKSLGILIALLLIAGAGVYTYARYTSSFAGTGEVEVAKWAVSLKQNSTAVEESFDLALNLSENNYVAEGKIAPGRTATAQLVLDLTGTEVATDYEFDLSSVNNLPTGVSISSVKATVANEEVTLDETNGKYTGTIDLANTGKPVTFDVTVTWDAEGNDVADTTTGKTVEKISIPVKVTVKQHIGE